MRHASTSSPRGFTLIELMVSLAVGLIVVGAAVKLFSQGVDATWVISQKAEMQQDLRATTNMLTKDISLAGAGLPLGQGIALPSATAPIYGFSPACPNCVGPGVAYPCASNAGPCVRTLYGLIPGFQVGIIPPGSGTRSDVITTVYSDVVFALNCYQVSIAAGTTLTLTAPPNPIPATWTPTCVLPAGLAAPQAVNNPVVGLQSGDLLLVQGKVGANTAYAVGEVTGVAGGPTVFTVTLAGGDTLNLNQNGAANDLSALAGSPALTPNIATRILVTTYYLALLPDPLGVGPGTTVLMRQVNGHPPVPVAENMVNLQFTYDTYDNAGNLLNESGDGGYSTGTPFNLIRKVNIAHLTIHSQLTGTRSDLMAMKGYQGYDVRTSISARNMSYQNRYGF